MTKADLLYRDIVIPGLDLLHRLGGPVRSDRADVLLVAISGQEADWTARKQLRGPARGLWQFERAGGVVGVLNHRATRSLALALCHECGIEPTSHAVHPALADDDVLACGFARLLLLTDPDPLPPVGDEQAAWQYYIDNWRPGKPHRSRWPACYRAALNAVQGHIDG